MHPPLQIKTIFNISARHTAGRFASGYFLGEILSELTKVNKPVVMCYFSISCKGAVLLSVKPRSCNLQRWLTKWSLNTTVPFAYHPTSLLTYYHITLVTYYPFAQLTFYPITLLSIFQVISRGHSITKQRYGISKDNDRQ